MCSLPQCRGCVATSSVPTRDRDLLDPADHGQLVVGEGGRHRVVVAVEAHEGQASWPAAARPGVARTVAVGSASIASRSSSRRSALVPGLPRTPAEQIGKTGAARCAFSSANDANDGTGTRKFRRPIADEVLDVALLVAPCDPAEAMREQVVALQAQELAGERPLGRADDLGDRDRGVVVARSWSAHRRRTRTRRRGRPGRSRCTRGDRPRRRTRPSTEASSPRARPSRARPAISTVASPKSNWASPGGWLSGTKTSALVASLARRRSGGPGSRCPRSRARLAGARRSALRCGAACAASTARRPARISSIDAEERARAWASAARALAIAGRLGVGRGSSRGSASRSRSHGGSIASRHPRRAPCVGSRPQLHVGAHPSPVCSPCPGEKPAGRVEQADGDGQVLPFSMITNRSEVLPFSMIVHTPRKASSLPSGVSFK